MPAAVRSRAVLLALLLSAWTIALGCFPVLTPEITRKSEQLSGSIRDEIADAPKRLFIVGVEERQGLRRYHLMVDGVFKRRATPEPLIGFVHDEATGQVAIVRETRDLPSTVPADAREVRLVYRHELKWSKERPSHRQQIDALLTNDGTMPTSIYLEPVLFSGDYVSLQFQYRDQHDIVRLANLTVIPRPLNQSPGLGALNRLNYLWSVPADVVIVVVGWTLFLPIGAAATSSGIY